MPYVWTPGYAGGPAAEQAAAQAIITITATLRRAVRSLGIFGGMEAIEYKLEVFARLHAAIFLNFRLT